MTSQPALPNPPARRRKKLRPDLLCLVGTGEGLKGFCGADYCYPFSGSQLNKSLRSCMLLVGIHGINIPEGENSQNRRGAY